jgi:hypothetical protein
MPTPNSQITSTPYDPDADLQDLLTNELAEVRVTYDADREIDLPGGLTAQQREYEMTLEDENNKFTLSGTETTSGLGMFLSLEGNLGFASGIILNHALMLGEPTQAYTDESLSNPSVEQYQDLTAEWYRPTAVDKGFPETRLQNRPVDFESTEVSLAELEKYARIWLSLD